MRICHSFHSYIWSQLYTHVDSYIVIMAKIYCIQYSTQICMCVRQPPPYVVCVWPQNRTSSKRYDPQHATYVEERLIEWNMWDILNIYICPQAQHYIQTLLIRNIYIYILVANGNRYVIFVNVAHMANRQRIYKLSKKNCW